MLLRNTGIVLIVGGGAFFIAGIFLPQPVLNIIGMALFIGGILVVGAVMMRDGGSW